MLRPMSTSLLVTTNATDVVGNWRLECLIVAGYPRSAALELSERRDVDLHVAVRLLETGCEVGTALRILR
jgi:hypothetical protein